MRSLVNLATLTAALALSAASPTGAQDHPGAVNQSVGPPVSQSPVAVPLRLTDEQRAKIRQAVKPKDTEETFQLKETQPAKDFEPAVGALVPQTLEPSALPPPLIYEMPVLERYAYLKVKRQILILDPMNRKVVDMIPEDQR